MLNPADGTTNQGLKALISVEKSDNERLHAKDCK